LDAAAEARSLLTAQEFWVEHGAWITEARPRFAERTARKVAAIPELAAREPAGALAIRLQVTNRLEELTAGGATVVLPTMPTTAPLVTAGDEDLDRYTQATMRFMSPASLAGAPQVSVPAARTADGLPVGLSLIGARGDDHHLLRLARLIRPAGSGEGSRR